MKSKKLTSILLSALMLIGASAVPITANAAENVYVETSATGNTSLNKSSLTLGAGENYTLKASTNYKAWKSSNAKVATVSKSGNVVAKNNGTATITMTAKNGKTASCKVTVKPLAKSISLNKTNITLGVGETFDFDSYIPNGYAAYFRLYYSNNSSIAKINVSGGLMTAVKPGTTTIYCKMNNGVKATCKITVKPMAQSISLNKTSITLGISETFDFNSYIPANTAAYYRRYYSNNSNIAKINAGGGLMTAMTPGTTSIYCKMNNGKTASCKVTVKPLAKSLTLNKTSLNLTVGEKFDFDSYTPANTAAYYRSYYSDNTKVVSVKAAGGLATALKPGTATIRCEMKNGTKATCKVTVKEAPKGIKLDKTNIKLTEGQSTKLNASFTNDTFGTIAFASSNKNVATVDKNGNIKAVKAGVATITATSGNKYATCKITVTASAKPSIKLDKTKVELGAGEPCTLKATVSPSQTVTWSSSNSKLVKVDSNGKLTVTNEIFNYFERKQTVKITAKAGTATATCTVTVNADRVYHKYAIIPVYEEKYEFVCKGCGRLIDYTVAPNTPYETKDGQKNTFISSEEEHIAHCKKHVAKGKPSGWYSDMIWLKVGERVQQEGWYSDYD